MVHGNKINKWSSADDTIKRNTLLMVFGCLHCTQPELFDSYFTRMSHCKAIRGNDSLLKLLRMKTESGRKRFNYQGALIFNTLPTNVRDESSVLMFRNKIKTLNFQFFHF